MENTNYIVRFVLILTAAVAIILTGLRETTKPLADRNEAIFNKRALLLSVEDYLGSKVDDLSDEQVQELFSEKIEQIVLDVNGEPIEGISADEVKMEKEKKKAPEDRKWPLYVFDSGNEKFYIMSVRGKGLWDEIWGAVALKNDLNTIAGVSFDHKAETPGLGAEIKDNKSFPEQFKNKQIYKGKKYVSVAVRKGGAKDANHEVDAIAGATVTCDGVTDMLKEGIAYYMPYLDQQK